MDLSLLVSADISGLTSGLANAGSQVKRFGDKAADTASMIGAIGGAAIVAGAALGAHLVRKTMESVDAQSKLAGALKTSYASMETLTRAASLSGVAQNQIESAAKKANIAIGELAQGSGAAGQALGKLGLNADSLISMPIDERINTINQAILAQVPASEQAAVAADIFGAKVGTAMLALDPDTMKRAKTEMEGFGLALSDVEAKQIENAGDELSMIAEIIRGVLTQAAVKLAPLVDAISKALGNAAIGSHGFSDALDSALNIGIEGAALLANVIYGVQTTFEVVGKGIVGVINSVVSKMAESVAWILDKLSSLPGVDFSTTVNSLNEFAALSANIAGQAADDIAEKLNKPLPGDALRQYVKEAQEASLAAAQAAVDGRKVIMEADSAASAEMTDKERESLAKKIEAIQMGLATESEVLLNHRNEQLAELAKGLDAEILTREEYNGLIQEVEADHQAKLQAIKEKADAAQKAIDDKAWKQKLDGVKGALGGMSTLMNSESRSMFEIGKAAATANGLINAYEAISSSYKVGSNIGGPMVGAAFAAAAGLAQFQTLSSIRSASFGGSGGSAPAAASNTTAINAANAPVQSQPQASQVSYVSIVGDIFGVKQMREMASMLQDVYKDGGRVVMA